MPGMEEEEEGGRRGGRGRGAGHVELLQEVVPKEKVGYSIPEGSALFLPQPNQPVSAANVQVVGAGVKEGRETGGPGVGREGDQGAASAQGGAQPDATGPGCLSWAPCHFCGPGF